MAEEWRDADVTEHEHESDHWRPYDRLFDCFQEFFCKTPIPRYWTRRRSDGSFPQLETENCARHHDKVDDESGDCDGNSAGLAKKLAKDSRTHERRSRRRRGQRRQYAFTQREV